MKKEQLVDKAGQELDKGVEKLVHALRTHGFPTQSSCFGHEEKDFSYPNIQIYTDDSHLDFEDYSPQNIEAKLEWILKNKRHLEYLNQLLEEFYGQRQVGYKYMLSAQASLDLVQIQLKSHGADTLSLQQKDFEKELHLYQNEMDAFTIFLESKV